MTLDQVGFMWHIGLALVPIGAIALLGGVWLYIAKRKPWLGLLGLGLGGVGWVFVAIAWQVYGAV